MYLVKEGDSYGSHPEQDPNSYGLIHGDINVGHCMSDQGCLTLFDFDECQCSWYVVCRGYCDSIVLYGLCLWSTLWFRM